MIDSESWSLTFSLVIFLVATLVVMSFGRWLAKLADQLADQTGLGEALIGALFLGAATSLPEITTTVTAAATQHADLAVSTALGGIAAQTVFLSVADCTYPRSNLEHAAASMANVMQGLLAIILIVIALLAFVTHQVAWFGIHPATPLMMGAYVYGLQHVYRTQSDPMWNPKHTKETQLDTPDLQVAAPSSGWLALRLMVATLMVGVGGWLIAQSGVAISVNTGLSETFVGMLFLALSTSFPELITVLAAVRHGALTLAIGGVLGGNSFDTLLLAFSDIAYGSGTIYQAISQRQVFLMALTILLTAILIMGLIRREKRGIANIGFESFLILMLYGGAILFLFSFEGLFETN